MSQQPWQPSGPPAQGYGSPKSPGINGLAIASMICGASWIYGVGAILALVFGYRAKSQICKSGQTGGALATAGIVLGWIGVVGIIVFVALIVLGSDPEETLGALVP